MLKMLYRLRRKKGFTLVELIIVTAILGVLMAGVAAFAGPVQRMVTATAVSADALNVNQGLGDYIEARLAFANYVTVVYGVNSDVASSELSTYAQRAAHDLDTDVVKPSKGGGGKAGVLIFKYIPNTYEKEKSSYKIYDVEFAKGTTAYIPPADATIEQNHAVFADAYYGNTQRMFVIPKDKVQQNSVRGDIYMTVDIYSYKGDPGYMDASDANSTYIKSTSLANVYAKTKDAATGLTELEMLTKIRTGPVESVTFKMHNCKNTGDINITAPGAGSGSDIMVFYYVPKFSYED